MAAPTPTLSFALQARLAKILQQNYFWTIMDTGLKNDDLLPIIPAIQSRAEGDSNLLLLRGGGYGVFDTSCPPSVLDIFPSCNVNDIRVSLQVW